MKLTDFFNNIGIKRKLMITGLVLALVPVVVVSAYLIYSVTNLSKSKAVALADGSITQFANNLQIEYTEQQNMVEQLSLDEGISSYAQTYYLSGSESFEAYLAYAKAALDRVMSEGIRTVVRIYTRNPTLYISAETNNLVSRLGDETWFKEGGAPGEIAWGYAPSLKNLSGRGYIACYKTEYESYDRTRIKRVVAVFKERSEYAAIFGGAITENKTVFIVAGDGTILCSSDRSLEGESAYNMFFSEETLTDLDNQQTVSYNGVNSIVFRREIALPSDVNQGWTVFTLIPEDEVVASVDSVVLRGLVIVAALIGVSVLLAVWLAGSITTRLSALMSGIDRVKEGSIETMEELPGRDEIADLSREFNQMIGRINELVNRVFVADIEKRDAQIAAQNIRMEKVEAERLALLRQINPHYLFNTLESIRMNLVIKDDRETAEVVRLFSKGIRSHIDYNDEYASLGEEMKFVDDYMQIQRYRFGDRFDYESYIEDIHLDCKVLRLIIQPLVENAVYHGIEKKAADGSIIIEAYEVCDDLHIKVTDNGGGMTEQTLAALHEKIYDGNPTDALGSSGIALKNVHNRLRLVYGERYGLFINSRLGVGTEAEIVIPLVRKE